MADVAMPEPAEGGGTPLPPKRPTIIRASKAGAVDVEPVDDAKPFSKPLPARPSPIPPGRAVGKSLPAHLQPSPDGHATSESDFVNVRRPLSSVGPTVNRPPPPIPGRPVSVVSSSHAASTPKIPPPSHKSTVSNDNRQNNNKNSSQRPTKKRLEITIVSARPMNEIGFRDSAPQETADLPGPPIKPNSKPVPDSNLLADKPPRPVSQAPPLQSSTKTPPVPSPRSSVPVASQKSNVPLPRLPAPQSQLPPHPDSVPSSKRASSPSDLSPVYAEPDEPVNTTPRRPPVPLIRPPSLPASFQGLEDVNDEENVIVTDVNKNKLKRPTIIRSGHSLRAAKSVEQDDSMIEVDAPAKPPRVPSSIKDVGNEKFVVRDAAEKEESCSQLPFRIKLRSTVTPKTPTSEMETSLPTSPDHILTDDGAEYAVVNKLLKTPKTATEEDQRVVPQIPVEDVPPPLPSPCKPKPSVKPKPTIVPKSKIIVDSFSTDSALGRLMVGTSGPANNESHCIKETDSIAPAVTTPRKPTIIRKISKTSSESPVDENPPSPKESVSSPVKMPPKPARLQSGGEDAGVTTDPKTTRPTCAAPLVRPTSCLGNTSQLSRASESSIRLTPSLKEGSTSTVCVEKSVSDDFQVSLSSERNSSEPSSLSTTDTQEEPQLRQRPPRPTERPKSVAVFPLSDVLSASELDSGEKLRPLRPNQRPASFRSKSSAEQKQLPPSRPSIKRTKQTPVSGKLPLPPRPGLEHPLYHYTLSQPHAIIHHSFETSEPGELPLKEGEVVFLVQRANEEWLIGKSGDREGRFPQNHVDIIHPLHDEISMFMEEVAPVTPVLGRHLIETSSGPRCEARFDFDGEGSGDLSFQEGDVIQLLERVGSEWLRGTLGGKAGIFPAAFVEVIEDLPAGSQVSADEADTAGAGSVVTALFDYEGLENELSFQAGQHIEVVGWVSEEWLMGRLGGSEGKCPANFVDRLPPNLPMLTGSASGASVAVTCDSRGSLLGNKNQSQVTVIAEAVAIFDYHSDQTSDLCFKTGEVISVLEYVGEEWLRGEKGGQQGLFPKSFVKIKSQEKASSLTSPVGVARALYDFTGQDRLELSFREGEIIKLGEFPPGNNEWRYGELDGKTGLFPVAYVENIS